VPESTCAERETKARGELNYKHLAIAAGLGLLAGLVASRL
jgi:hypothetical protein